MSSQDFDLIISNVRLYGEGEPVNVAVSDGTIQEISDSALTGAEVIDGNGAVLLPGLVDLYAVLGEPGNEATETIASGTRAAARGGYTAVCAAPSGKPLTDSTAVAESIWYKGLATASCDVYPLATLTQGRGGEQLVEMGMLKRCEAEVPMFTDGTKTVASGSVMRRALEYSVGEGVTVAAHCEDASLTAGSVVHEGQYSGWLGLRGAPRAAEDSVVARDLYLARDTDARLHLRHISTRGAVELIEWAHEKDVPVTAEVTPHNLFFDHSELETFNSNFKVNPPLRDSQDVAAVRKALLDGTIDCVVSDHTPRPLEEKECEFNIASYGVTSLETALPAVAELFVESGEADWRFIARVFSERPAEIAGLSQHGRPLKVGEPANLTVVSPDKKWTVDADGFESLSQNNPFIGHTFNTQVLATVRGGEVSFQA